MNAAHLSSITQFLAGASQRPADPELIDLAKQCMVDWMAVSLGARDDTGPMIARRLMRQWQTRGKALSLYGDTGAAAPMALVNATLSHSLDYDDMHFDTAVHASGPTWAATLAMGMARGASEHQILQAFITGYEVCTAMGEQGVGPRLADAGWHPTGVLGHFGAAASAASLLGLNRSQIQFALGLAATQAAGLQASGGSMAKPYHVGKAAMNGIMAAELASMGMDADTRTLDEHMGLLSILFQRPTAAALDSLGKKWRIKGNTFKPYASCQLTHAAHETARALAGRGSPDAIKEIRVHVHPLAIKVAGRPSASTPMEGKFSIAYCVALGLLGHDATADAFVEERVTDPEIRRLTALIRVLPDEHTERCAARVELDCGSAGIISHEIQAVRGSPLCPLNWSDLENKFLSLTRPILGADAETLLKVLRDFERPGQLSELSRIIRTTATNRLNPVMVDIKQ